MTHEERPPRLHSVQIDIGPDTPEPLELAKQIVSLFFDLEAPNAEIANNFRMSLSAYDLGPMQISICTSSASVLRRSPALIALTRTDQFIVQFYRSGGFDMTIDGKRTTVPSGAVAFFDLSRPCDIDAEAVDNLSLNIPPDALLPLVADPHSIHGLVLQPDSEMNVALILHLEDFWLRLPDLTPEEAREEALSLAAMLAEAIGAHSARRSVTRAHLRKNQFGAICRWIDSNLGNPMLGAAAIIGKFHITRPTLYRMFEQRGGVMKYILERRLEKVFQDLVDPDLPRENIGALFNLRGLRDHTSAGRAFRAYFGITPREVRSSRSSPPRWSPANSTDTFQMQNVKRLQPVLEKHGVQMRITGAASPLAQPLPEDA